MDIGAIRTALAVTLQDACGVQFYDRATQNPDPPCGMITVAPFGADVTYSNGSNLRFLVLLLAPAVDLGSGQSTLDAWISSTGSKSVERALNASHELGGVVESVLWSGIDAYDTMSLSDGGTTYLAVRCLVDVLA